MSDDDRSCPSCGARVPDDAEQCTFCGTSVGDEEASGVSDESPEAPPPPEDEAASAPEAAREEAETPAPASVYCHQCGFENPVEANYCSQCGTELQDLDVPENARPVTADLPEGEADGADDEGDASSAEAGAAGSRAEMQSQLLWMVGIGVAIVLGFFFVTQWSQQYEWSEESTDASAPAASDNGPRTSGPSASGGGPNAPGRAGPASGGASNRGTSAGGDAADLESLVEELGSSLDGADTGSIDSLRAEIDKATGDRKQEVQAELVQRYTGIGATGRAALVQQQLADATESVEDRRRAADLLYRWMQKVAQQQNRAQSARVARHVASAYEAVVEKQPDDLDARTRMGEAYLLTNSPMKGIRAINGVLEEDSTFVPARFQKGLALLQISRLDEAIQEFEKVKTFSEPTEPFYQQAERAVKVIRERRSSGGGE